MKQLQGKSISNGYAIGKIYYMRRECLSYEQKGQSISAENKLLEQGLQHVRNELTEAIEHSEGQIDSDLVALLEAQLLMTNDELYLDMISTGISSGDSALYAIETATQQLSEQFAMIDDPYFKARIEDIKDISLRLQHAIIGKPYMTQKKLSTPSILVAEELRPSETIQLDRKMVLGIVLKEGSMTGHTAILARAMGIPMLVDVEIEDLYLHTDEQVVVDGESGKIFYDCNTEELAGLQSQYDLYQSMIKELAVYKDHDSRTIDRHLVEVYANISSDQEVEQVVTNGGQGIGLFRTEFLYMQNEDELPNEQKQYEIYRSVLLGMSGKPVIIRTMDIGGDKEIPSLSMKKEENPFLGQRAIRYCLEHDDIFRVQLRALLRASVHGDLRIMFPMISTLEEIIQAKEVLKQEEQKLLTEGIEVNNYQVGMMIEVPSAALLADVFAKEVDFFSIGSNDLIQYTMATDRTNKDVMNLYQSYHPSVLRLIAYVIDQAHRHHIPCGVCGELASDPIGSKILIGMGADELSVNPSAILRIKKNVCTNRFDDLHELVLKINDCTSQEDVIDLMKK